MWEIAVHSVQQLKLLENTWVKNFMFWSLLRFPLLNLEEQLLLIKEGGALFPPYCRPIKICCSDRTHAFCLHSSCVHQSLHNEERDSHKGEYRRLQPQVGWIYWRAIPKQSNRETPAALLGIMQNISSKASCLLTCLCLQAHFTYHKSPPCQRKHYPVFQGKQLWTNKPKPFLFSIKIDRFNSVEIWLFVWKAKKKLG